MKIAPSPYIPPVPTIARANTSPAKNDQPSTGVSHDKSHTVELQPMELSRQFNIQFLMLQQEMQMENRKFTTLSNVMKTKHSTASAA